jgi:hypothetical protein
VRHRGLVSLFLFCQNLLLPANAELSGPVNEPSSWLEEVLPNLERMWAPMLGNVLGGGEL